MPAANEDSRLKFSLSTLILGRYSTMLSGMLGMKLCDRSTITRYGRVFSPGSMTNQSRYSIVGGISSYLPANGSHLLVQRRSSCC